MDGFLANVLAIIIGFLVGMLIGELLFRYFTKSSKNN